MTILIVVTHELVTLEQIISKRICSHLNNHGIAFAELTIDHHFWSQFAFLQNGSRSAPIAKIRSQFKFCVLRANLALYTNW